MNEHQLIQELHQLVQNKSLQIIDRTSLKNIEFVNIFADVEELVIDNCESVIPKLNNDMIKRLVLLYNNIKNLKDLVLPKLEELDIQEDYIQGECNEVLKSIGEFKVLTQLKICGYRGIDLNLIKQFKQVTTLQLCNCEIQNISILTQFGNLIKLSLFDNENIDINPLKLMTVQVLDLGCCCLKNIEALKFQSQLRELQLQCNLNINIFNIQFLRQLITLNLDNCALIDITYLTSLTNLKHLQIAQNNIVYLEPLQDLNQIKSLDAHSNCIQNTTALKKHSNFNSYQIYDQNQPSKFDIIFANLLRDINIVNSLICKIGKSHYDLTKQIDLQCDQVILCLRNITQNQYKFIGQVASLFKYLNTQQDQQ
ncbi:leucine-rich_repeat domain-containing protein [Hexamita inflata]|uniref:Leucine-rich repeat domain-containing protein n=1 Tax=Hexamita inflata TaxID=28002 RepID=A0AA86NTD4_9EUKA|nr:leucine-rich repeat domain-containing protein [Hexamita inflata]